MPPAMKVQGTWLQGFLCLVAAGGWLAPPLQAQTLHLERLGNGTELVLVGQPLADATTVVWPGLAADGGRPRVVVGGALTLVADLEAAMGGLAAAPPVVVAVGAAPTLELRGVLERLAPEGSPSAPSRPPPRPVDEGRIERRLGPPGSDVEIRLEVNLPPAADPLRTPVEVLWDILPEALSTELVGLRTRVDGGIGVLEARARAADVEMTLRRLRLGLATIASNPSLQPAMIEAAAERLVVRRRAALERHPEAALGILELWLDGGAAAVREFLFGGDGLTVAGVQEAARSWLPQHPGAAVVVLPPQAFNPRFASPPQVLQLESGLTAVVLERPGSQLAAACLRPVVVPDLDDDAAAAILTRVAAELRSLAERPGSVEVRTAPSRLELAASPEAFAEMLEALRRALAAVAADEQPVALDPGDARRRALHLAAGLLGVADGAVLSPASLLRWDNLALGLVVEDEETAIEAVRKFWAFDSAHDGASVRMLAPVPRTREAVAGSSSTVVVALDLGEVPGEAEGRVVAEILARRGAALFSEHSFEVLRPFVPGRRVLLVVVSAAAPVEEIERMLHKAWPALTRAPRAQEIEALRREVAAADSAFWSGASGRARRCAAVAVGEAGWRPAVEMELAVLSLSVEQLETVFESLRELEAMPLTGAGLLPIVESDAR